MNHRRVPTPHWRKGNGICRWCGEAVLKPNGEVAVGRWHPACVQLYKIAAWPAEARKAVWLKDRGVCQGCGFDLAAAAQAKFADQYPDMTVESLRISLPNWAPKWQCDHRVALVLCGGSVEFFALSNMQVLCSGCHRTKTTADVRKHRLSRDPQTHLL